jgi:undecaprenyl diphosphate synthase
VRDGRMTTTESVSTQSTLPRHIVVVMDGNGRWAKRRFLPRTAGHKAGVNATRRLVELCARAGVSSLTLFAFSSENWSRPDQEVSSLMSLFVSTINSEIETLHKQGIRIRFIGERGRFGQKLRDSIDNAERTTAANTGMNLNIAANYGGRWDILNAARALADQVAAGELVVDQIDDTAFTRQLSLHDLAEPDLFIRTGGESRISNFLLWQLAYTELYFTDVLWPDFDETEFNRALDWYTARQRRFGKIGEQIEVDHEKTQRSSR